MIIRKNSKKIVPLVLASKSNGRKQILKEIGVDFIIDPANIDEESYKISNPLQLVKTLSLAKAKLIALKHVNSLILAADTIVVKDGEIIGKPKDKTHAQEMLTKLVGATHEVVTGLSLLDTETTTSIVKYARSIVEFHKLTTVEIDTYAASNEWIGKAGGYSSQEQGGKILIKKIDGEASNVVGLPKNVFFNMLNELNLQIVDK